LPLARSARRCGSEEEHVMNNIVWWVGAIVIILAILGFLGFR
jgi:hypothetical protein